MVGTLQELTVELGPVFHSDNILTSTLYHDLASTERIDAFLDASQTPFSRTSVGSPRGRWKSVPKAVKLEETISQSLLGIIEQIRGEFPSNRTVPSGVSRAVRDTSNLDLRYENGLKMRPDMLVVAAGPSFEVPSRASECFCGLDDLGYTNAASIFEVRRQRAKGTDQEHLEQLGLHCQQILKSQPNRNYARALLITETMARLVHCDRTGTTITPFFNYHNDPHAFIRLILGLTSSDEATLGLDTTVQWKIEGGKKVSGTIVTVGLGNTSIAEQDSKVYRLEKIRPVFARSTTGGRGTTCWLVEGSNAQTLLIKDSWRTGKRMAEHEYLDAAKEVKGVVHMISYQYLGQTSDYVPPGCVSDPALQNRSKLRLVMEAHGLALDHYHSRHQLVAALRSAIRAHRQLYSAARVLHRDISVLNILLGDEGDPEDGYLIDLDMAVFHDDPPREISVRVKTGTRIYQSIAVLQSYRIMDGEMAPPHDYLDDLESFFYVLSELMMTRVCDGREVNAEAREILKSWDTCDQPVAKSSKTCFVKFSLNRGLLDSEYWGKACLQLFKDFRKFIQEIVDEKAEIRAMEDSDEEKMELFKAMRQGDKLDAHYDALDALFGKALDALKTEEPLIEARLALAKIGAVAPVVTPLLPPLPAPTAIPSDPAPANPVPLPRRGVKRRLKELEEIEAAAPPKRRSTRIIRRVVPFVNWK